MDKFLKSPLPSISTELQNNVTLPCPTPLVVEKQINSTVPKQALLVGNVWFRDATGTSYTGQIPLNPQSYVLESKLLRTQNVGETKLCLGILTKTVSQQEAEAFIQQILIQAKNLPLKSRLLNTNTKRLQKASCMKPMNNGQ